MRLTPTGSKVGPYQIGSLLGEGAMGRAYSGEKDDYGPVALKVSIDAEFESLLLSEAEALKKVSHPNIVPYVDWIEFDTGHALVMGYLDGESLEERFAQRPLSQDEVHTMATGIGDALATAHRAGVIHRDIKPSNLMLKQDGVQVGSLVRTRDLPAAELGRLPVRQVGSVVGSVGVLRPLRPCRQHPSIPAGQDRCLG